MIISASRRTDIPAFYSDWFINRIREGFVYVRNPVNPKQISRISLSPDTVDGIVFWTKDPSPMLSKLTLLQDYPYYFQFTLNPYSTDIEKNVPSKEKTLIPAFRRLAETIGPDKVVWRYDPIIISDNLTAEYHIEYFEKIARRLYGYTEVCTFSFLDIYRNTAKHMNGIPLRPIDSGTMHRIASAFSEIAGVYGIQLQTCAEAINLSEYGISHAHCIDTKLFERITGNHFKYSKDQNQRLECGCAASIDIGAYDCCTHGCKYCYATHSLSAPAANKSLHDPTSPLLIGNISAEDKITIREHRLSSTSQIHMDI